MAAASKADEVPRCQGGHAAPKFAVARMPSMEPNARPLMAGRHHVRWARRREPLRNETPGRRPQWASSSACVAAIRSRPYRVRDRSSWSSLSSRSGPVLD